MQISNFTQRELYFAPVFNYGFYRQSYPDLEASFGNDRKKYLWHFLRHGMKEGRIASPRFNVYVYRDCNPDLKMRFGNDLKKYFYYCLERGFEEKRRAY